MTARDERVRVPELAEHLGCSERTARELMGSAIPATRVGGRWTTTWRDVDQYLKAQTVVGRRRKGRARSISSA